MAADREEQLLLRIQDADLAERLHAVLSERPGAPKDPTVELRFDGDILLAMHFLKNRSGIPLQSMAFLACTMATHKVLV